MPQFMGGTMRTTPNGFGQNWQAPRSNVQSWTPQQMQQRIASLPAPQFRTPGPATATGMQSYVNPSSATTGPYANSFAQAQQAKPTGQSAPQPYRGHSSPPVSSAYDGVVRAGSGPLANLQQASNPARFAAGQQAMAPAIQAQQQAQQQYLQQNAQQAAQAAQPLTYAGYQQAGPAPGNGVSYGGYSLPQGMTSEQFATAFRPAPNGGALQGQYHANSDPNQLANRHPAAGFAGLLQQTRR